jgi:outer membrane protein TolC
MNKYILIILLPNLIYAQDTLSLIDALKIGLNNNYDIQISKKKKDISRINNSWSNAGALPTISISGNKEESISDQSNNPTSFVPYQIKASSINSNANIKWTLFNGFAIRANKKRLENLEYISNNNTVLTIENTIQGIILQYYNCIIQKRKAKLLQKVVKIAKERLEYQKTKYELGVSSKIDLLQIENSMLTDSSNLIIQQLNYINSLKNLNLTLGQEINKDWFLIDKINNDIKLYNLKDLENSTISNNTNIRNQYFNLQLSKQDIKLSMSPFFPIISLNSGAAYNESTYDIGDLASTMDNTGESINFFANFSLNLRIFDGGKLYQNIKALKIQHQINELQLNKVTKDVLYELSLLYDEYKGRINSYNLNKKAFDIAKTNYDLANDKENRGVINSFILRDIETTYINSGINFQQATYNLVESKISLIKITGGIIQEYN